MKQEQEEQDYNVGSLVIFKDITKEQKDIFIKLISDDYSYMYQLLFNIINDDKLTLELIDIFAGKKFIFPDRKKLHKLLFKIQVYTYVKSKNYSTESYQLLARQYKKRVSQIKAIVSRVDYLLNNGTYKDLENLDKQA